MPTSRQLEPELVKYGADLVDLRGARLHQQVTHIVKRHDALLLLALDGHEPHARSLRRFPDRRRISGIGLVGLHERPDEFRCDESRLMAHRCEPPCPMM